MSTHGHGLGLTHDAKNTFQSEEKAKLDFPFDLDKLIDFSHTFDQLKLAIEYLARQQGDQQVLINELLTKEPTHTVIERDRSLPRSKMDQVIEQLAPASRSSSRSGSGRTPRAQASTKPDAAPSGGSPRHLDVPGEKPAADSRQRTPSQKSRPGDKSTHGLDKAEPRGTDALPTDVLKSAESGPSASSPAPQQKDSSNAENATRFSALGKQALENQKAQEALAGDLAKLNEFIGTAERRIKELEKQVMQHRNKHEQHAADFDDHNDRLRKLESNNKIASIMSGPDMGEDKVNMILNAINEISDSVKADIDKKLEDFVHQNSFDDVAKEQGGLFRRVQNLEKDTRKAEEQLTENIQKIDNNRKSCTRNARDLDKLAKQLASGDFKAPEKQDESEEDEEGEELGGEAFTKLQALISRTEKQLIMRIAKCEDHSITLQKHGDAFVNVEQTLIKLQRAGAGSGGGSGIGASQGEVDAWNDAANKIAQMEEDLSQMKRDMAGLDGAKIKADVLQLFKITANIAPKELLEGLKEDIRRIKQELADSAYEITNTREQIAKQEKDMKKQEKDLRKDIATNRAKIDAAELAISALKRAAGNAEQRKARLNEARNHSPNASAAAGSDLADLDDELKLLRLDHEQLAAQVRDQLPQMQNDLDQKASKADLEELERQLQERMNDMFSKMREMYPEKEAIKKKFLGVEKNIKNLYDLLMKQVNKAPQEDDAMFTKRYVGPANCASCEKGIVNLIGQPVDYHAWKRLPFREPSERIARYGQGFSKILTMMRPSESTSQVRADHYSAMGNPGGGGGGNPGPDDMNRTHGLMDQKLYVESEDLHVNHPDFLMTMSPQVRRRNNDSYMNTEETTNDHSQQFAATNANTQYNSHAKISGRSGHKKNSVEHVGHHQLSAVLPDQYDSNKLPGVKQASNSKSRTNNQQSKRTF